MINTGDVKIKRVTAENYHLYDDMVYWRMNNKERTAIDKEHSKAVEYLRAYDELSKPGFYVFAAEYESRFIGWIHIVYIPKIGVRWSNGILFVDELWVAPKYRRQGVATELFDKVYEIQNVVGAKGIRLYTDNPNAEKLYQKCGLKTVNASSFMETD